MLKMPSNECRPMIWAAIAGLLDNAYAIERIVKQRLDPKHSPTRRKE